MTKVLTAKEIEWYRLVFGPDYASQERKDLCKTIFDSHEALRSQLERVEQARVRAENSLSLIEYKCSIARAEDLYLDLLAEVIDARTDIAKILGGKISSNPEEHERTCQYDGHQWSCVAGCPMKQTIAEIQKEGKCGTQSIDSSPSRPEGNTQ